MHISLAALCLLVGFAVATWRHPARLHVDPIMDLGSIRAMERRVFTIRVRNPHWVRSVRLTGADASCGCTTLALAAVVIAPRSSADVEIAVEPAPADARIDSIVSIHADGLPPERARVTATITPPFAGWPDRLAAIVEGEDLWTPIDPQYEGVLLGGHCSVDASRRVFPVRVDLIRHRLTIDGGAVLPIDSTANAILQFQAEDGIRKEWSGWLVEYTP